MTRTATFKEFYSFVSHSVLVVAVNDSFNTEHIFIINLFQPNILLHTQLCSVKFSLTWKAFLRLNPELNFKVQKEQKENFKQHNPKSIKNLS